MANKLNSDSFDISKALKEEGVYAYGFGHIAKAAMYDRDLSCAAKGIYAYFCSFTNAKNTAYPKLTTILRDLGINKRTYYKHFEQLVDNGYISIKKAEGYKNKNVYIINEQVPKINNDLTEDNNSDSLLIIDSIKSFGYGTVPKLAMIDKRLTIKAKALMAFLLSLSGAGKCAFPRRDAICMYLGVNKNTYVNMMNELIMFGYIKVTQRRTRKGNFAVNDYHFEINPMERINTADSEMIAVDKDVKICGKDNANTKNIKSLITEALPNNGLNSEFSPRPKNCTFLKNGLNSELSPCPKNCTFLKEDRVLKTAPSPCPKNCTNNNINNNNSNTVMKSTSILYPDNKVSINMPTGIELKKSLHIISKYDYYRQYSDTYANKHCKAVDIIVSLFSEKIIIHKNTLMNTADLWRSFVHVLNNKYSSATPCVDFIYDVLVYYEQCISMYKIEHPTRYLRTLIIDKIISDYDNYVLS